MSYTYRGDTVYKNKRDWYYHSEWNLPQAALFCTRPMYPYQKRGRGLSRAGHISPIFCLLDTVLQCTVRPLPLQRQAFCRFVRH